jgi:hypothetical protein
MMMRTNSPAIAGTKYMSATVVGVDVGAGVAEVGETMLIPVSPLEP